MLLIYFMNYFPYLVVPLHFILHSKLAFIDCGYYTIGTFKQSIFNYRLSLLTFALLPLLNCVMNQCLWKTLNKYRARVVYYPSRSLHGRPVFTSPDSAWLQGRSSRYHRKSSSTMLAWCSHPPYRQRVHLAAHTFMLTFLFRGLEYRLLYYARFICVAPLRIFGRTAEHPRTLAGPFESSATRPDRRLRRRKNCYCRS